MQSSKFSAQSKELSGQPSCAPRKAVGSTMVHVDDKGIIDGLWKGEMKCIGPRAPDADLWIAIWEELSDTENIG